MFLRLAKRSLHYCEFARGSSTTSHVGTAATSTASGIITSTCIEESVSKLYLRGRKRQWGQHRAVVAVTGGGGQIFGWMLSEPGASKCLLEALVPYDKQSCLEFLQRHERRALSRSIGFCSEEMSSLLAASACDRALQLTPYLDEWPYCVGVASTSTIVSHYQRRGGYRCHAAAIKSNGQGHRYTHAMVKGERERPGEDQACALLTLRAFLEVCGESSSQLTTTGIRTHKTFVITKDGAVDERKINAVGEKASGVEVVPEAVHFTESGWQDSIVLVPDAHSLSYSYVAAPTRLPEGAIVVVDCGSSRSDAIRGAKWVRKALGRYGDEERRSWSTPPAPVFFHARNVVDSNRFLLGSRANSQLLNWGVLMTPTTENIFEPKRTANAVSRLKTCLRMYSTETTFLTSARTAVDLITSSLAENDNEILTSIASGTNTVVVLEGETTEELEEFRAALNQLPLDCMRDSFVLLQRGPIVLVEGFTLEEFLDGSESTENIRADYTGEWDEENSRPHGHGLMTWDNGITYSGEWRDGKYHGHGSKTYSRGGGYQGEWRDGKRDGWGTSYYDGKWGYSRWEGPFVSDKPHGVGTMFYLGKDDLRHPGRQEFEAFDVDHNGKLNFNETVGRLCGRYGMRREDAEAVFRGCDNDGDGQIDKDEFLRNYDAIVAAVGGEFPRCPDQLPPFEFVHGIPVLNGESK